MASMHKWSRALAGDSPKSIKQNEFKSTYQDHSGENYYQNQKKMSRDVAGDITNSYQGLMKYFQDDKHKTKPRNLDSKMQKWTQKTDFLKSNAVEQKYLGINKYVNSGYYLYNHDDLQNTLQRKRYKRGELINEINAKQLKVNREHHNSRYRNNLNQFMNKDVPVKRYQNKETDYSSDGNEHNIYGHENNSRSQINYKYDNDTYGELESKIYRRAQSNEKNRYIYEKDPYEFMGRSAYIKYKSTDEGHQDCVYCRNNLTEKNRKIMEKEEMKHYINELVKERTIIQKEPVYIRQVVKYEPLPSIKYIQHQPQVRHVQHYVQPVTEHIVRQPSIKHIVQREPSVNYVHSAPQQHPVPHFPQQQHHVVQHHTQQQYVQHAPQQFVQNVSQQYVQHAPQQYVQHAQQYVQHMPQQQYVQHVQHQPQQQYVQHMPQQQYVQYAPQQQYLQYDPQQYTQQVSEQFVQQIPQQYFQHAPQQYMIQQTENHVVPQFVQPHFTQQQVLVQQRPMSQKRVSLSYAPNHQESSIITTPQYLMNNVTYTNELNLAPSNLTSHIIQQPQLITTPELRLTKSNTPKANRNSKTLQN